MKRIPLFKLLGFQVSVDLSWLILAILVTWSLAVGLFPALYPDLTQMAYWSMGIVGMVGLLMSIVVHELSHSLVARVYGLPISGITLFIFGGVAEMDDEPVSPRAEFFVAIVGPITSLAVAAVCFGFALGAIETGLPATVAGVLSYLATINLVLAVFNMVPAFPLDGGRVLRAALWGWKGDYLKATRIASYCGSAFGFLLIALAVFSLLSGNFIAGMWWFLIGLFVRGAAHASYERSLVRQTLHDVPVSRLMTRRPVTVDPSLSLHDLVNEYFYKHYFKSFPVQAGTKLAGCVNLRDLGRIPRENWQDHSVKDIMQKCSESNTVDASTDAASALSRMMQAGAARLLVTEDGGLVGILSQSDVLRFLAVKLHIEGEAGAAVGLTEASDQQYLARHSR